MKNFCDIKLLKKIPYILFYYWNNKIKLNNNYNLFIKKYQIKTMSRSSTILPFFEQCIVSVHNGKKYVDILINKNHFFYKFGEFSLSKIICRHNFKKKKK